MREKLPLCKYAKDCSSGVRVLVKCTITKDFCPNIRWCPVNNCPKMNNDFKSFGCKKAILEDLKREKKGCGN